MKANLAITSFNAGELSPLLGGRPDLEKWQAGLSYCKGMIPQVQGALMRAAGSVYVSTVKDSDDKVWLAPFVFSRSNALILEFGPEYVRFYYNRAVLLDGSDPYEVETPYLAADLTRPDGTFGIRFEQSGDILYLACAGHAPRTLTRNANDDWTLALFIPEGGPFQDQNTVDISATTVTVAGTYTVGGAVTVTATAPLFLAGHEGGLMEIELEDGADTKSWQVRTKTIVGNQRRADFKFYVCTQVGPTNTTDKPAICGEEVPVHTKGKYWDGTGVEQKGDGAVGSIGVEWEYLHSGYGWISITDVNSATEAEGVVMSRLPAELATQATHRWALPAWSDVDGWPDNVCFFRERLTWFRGQQQWTSVAGDFKNFRARTHGEVLPDSAVVISIQSAQGNAVQWVAPTKNVLFVGTGGAEHTIKQQTSQQPFGPGNTQQDPETPWGGTGLKPISVGPGVVFAEKSGRRLRLLIGGQDGYEALDLNKYHGLLPSPIVSAAWQQTPHEAMWCAMANGDMRAVTLQLEDKVISWHRHLSGVESLAVIPSPDGTRDDVWMIVSRTINGETVRYVEYRAAEYVEGDDRALSVYSQCALTYSGVGTSSLTGLDHLEGETVNVLTNGAAHPQRTVTAGAITLQAACTKAVVGLPNPYSARLMPLEGGGSAGTSQGQKKRVHALTARLLDSLGGRFGPAFGTTDAVQYRTPGLAMEEAPPLFTGDKVLTFPGTFDGAATIAIEGSDDFPFTICALFPELVTNDG